MRSEAYALIGLMFAACTGDDLSLGDGRAADSGMQNPQPTLPNPSEDAQAQAPRAELEPPRVIAELESDDVSDDDPSLTADLLVLCFNSKREAGMGEEDIWCSQRASSADPWDPPEPQTSLNSEHRETGIALSFDGLSLWFSSDRAESSSGLDVYLTTRPTRDAPWYEPTRVAELSSEDDDLVSSIDEAEQRLMLARRTRGGDNDNYDIFVAQRASRSDPWQAPAPVAELNTDQDESDAFLIGSGLELLFSRNADLHLARRASPDAVFDQIEPLSVLNSEARERDAWSNSTFTYVVFSSDRAGSYRLYESRRP